MGSTTRVEVLLGLASSASLIDKGFLVFLTSKLGMAVVPGREMILVVMALQPTWIGRDPD
jgi:hypothetical protein